MQITTDGLIIRDIESGDTDRLLTILTPEYGRLNVMAKGARSMKSRVMSGTQLFTYSDFELYEKSGYYWTRGVNIIEPFMGISASIEKMSLAAYLSDIAYELSGEGEPGIQIMKLTLNSFYAMAKDRKPLSVIKAVFELRAAGYSGYMPDVSCCRGCHSDNTEVMYLDVMNGRLLCSDCSRRAYTAARIEEAKSDDIREAVIILPMSRAVTEAVRYILRAEPSKMLSFSLAENEIPELARVAETYLLSHLGRGFQTLDFYKTIYG